MLAQILSAELYCQKSTRFLNSMKWHCVQWDVTHAFYSSMCALWVLMGLQIIWIVDFFVIHNFSNNTNLSRISKFYYVAVLYPAHLVFFQITPRTCPLLPLWPYHPLCALDNLLCHAALSFCFTMLFMLCASAKRHHIINPLCGHAILMSPFFLLLLFSSTTYWFGYCCRDAALAPTFWCFCCIYL